MTAGLDEIRVQLGKRKIEIVDLEFQIRTANDRLAVLRHQRIELMDLHTVAENSVSEIDIKIALAGIIGDKEETE
jgi:hypothetical protein